MKRILFFFGGCSTEYPVSLQSAQAVLEHLTAVAMRPDGGHHSGGQVAPLHRGPGGHRRRPRWQQQGNCTPCALIPDRGVKELLLLDGTGTLLPL